MKNSIVAVIPVLMSSNVETALLFYAKLGFVVDFKDDPSQAKYAGISRDGVKLHLQWQDPSHWAHALDRPVYRFAVTDLDKTYAEFFDNGVLAANPKNTGPYAKPGNTPWGTREFHLYDLDGNGLQFIGSA
jgi:hypothetical protein